LRLYIDRIENGIAVCLNDDDEIFKIDKKYFPYECLEGDIIDAVLEDGIPTFIAFNIPETKKRRGTLSEMLEKLRKGR